VGAIRLLDVSIRRVETNSFQRLKAYDARGREESRRSVLLYHLGVRFGRLKLWNEAGAVCRAAAELDPFFVWLLNFAWMAATATDPQAHACDLATSGARSRGSGSPSRSPPLVSGTKRHEGLANSKRGERSLTTPPPARRWW
jgi:hypothetical protein